MGRNLEIRTLAPVFAEKSLASRTRKSRTKITVIGGGAGLTTVLTGLRTYPCLLSAVVSSFDSGGSSGKIRRDFGTLPFGDLRRALLPLAEEKDEHSKILGRIFELRFGKGEGLIGHAFGNLFLLALTEVHGGEERKALMIAHKLLGVKGKVLPITYEKRQLCARLEDGNEVIGEHNIDVPKHDPKLRIRDLYLDSEAEADKEVRRAAREADLIVIGPGDLYTSVLPNFLPKGMSEAVNSARAKKVYVCNILTKRGETNDFSVGDHLKEVIRYSKARIDYTVFNTKVIPKGALRVLEERGFSNVRVDEEEIIRLSSKPVAEDLVLETNPRLHDPVKLARTIISLAH